MSLAQSESNISSLVEIMGISEVDFRAIIRAASEFVKIPKRSGREYPLGAIEPKISGGM